MLPISYHLVFFNFLFIWNHMLTVRIKVNNVAANQFGLIPKHNDCMHMESTKSTHRVSQDSNRNECVPHAWQRRVCTYEYIHSSRPQNIQHVDTKHSALESGSSPQCVNMLFDWKRVRALTRVSICHWKRFSGSCMTHAHSFIR